MVTAEELKLRRLAVDAALRTADIRSAPLHEEVEAVIDRAREFYLYLSGQSPAHPKPSPAPPDLVAVGSTRGDDG